MPKFGSAAVEAELSGIYPKEFRDEISTLVRMEGRDIMPPELFAMIQGSVEMQSVKAEERRKQGIRRDRPDRRQPGGSSAHQLWQPSGGNPNRDLRNNHNRGNAIVKEEPVARGDSSRRKFSGNCFQCGGQGHFSRQCPRRRDLQQQRQQGQAP